MNRIMCCPSRNQFESCCVSSARNTIRMTGCLVGALISGSSFLFPIIHIAKSDGFEATTVILGSILAVPYIVATGALAGALVADGIANSILKNPRYN